jgi:hypothetical protein
MIWEVPICQTSNRSWRRGPMFVAASARLLGLDTNVTRGHRPPSTDPLLGPLFCLR